MAQCHRCQDAAWCRVSFAFLHSTVPGRGLSQAGGTVKLPRNSTWPFASDEFSERGRKWRVYYPGARTTPTFQKDSAPT